MRPGPTNLITDVAGLTVGNAQDATLRSGVTVVTGDAPFIAGVHVMGGAPGTRETDLLAPDRLVQEVDALVLSGGSAFGLDAASGVMDALRTMGRGFQAGTARVPIVPAAILFDLLNGGEKAWDANPYAALGRAAFDARAATTSLGSLGAGFGATAGPLRGGLGSASVTLDSGFTVGALVAVNAFGSATAAEHANFWAAPFEFDGEFGGLGPVSGYDPSLDTLTAGLPGQNTTIAIVATDAALSQAQATRVAIAAHDGLARAIVPAHTPMDGDLVFAASTAAKPLGAPVQDVAQLGHAAAVCLARAIARGVYLADPSGGIGAPAWCERYGA